MMRMRWWITTNKDRHKHKDFSVINQFQVLVHQEKISIQIGRITLIFHFFWGWGSRCISLVIGLGLSVIRFWTAYSLQWLFQTATKFWRLIAFFWVYKKTYQKLEKQLWICKICILCEPAMLSRRKLSGDPPETLHGRSPDFLAKSHAGPHSMWSKKKARSVQSHGLYK